MDSIKSLLSEEKIRIFLIKRVNKYFPGSVLIDCKVKPLKVYLDHKTVVAQYFLKLKNEKGKIFEKIIVGKAEEEGAGVFNDYSTIKFLRKMGIEDIVPEPLDYIKSINLYLYNFVPGFFLQKLSEEKKDRDFLDKIPSAIKALKRIHEVEIKERKNNENEGKEWKRDIKLIKDYWPLIFDKTYSWIKDCRSFRKKNTNIFSPELYKMTHGDFYSRNILVDNKNIKLIDFSNSIVCDPLNDVGNFFINTELMLEYDFPYTYRQLMDELNDIFIRDYFLRAKTKEEELKINYFTLKNLIRIIAFAAMSEGSKKPRPKSSEVIEKLIRFGEEKYKNIL